MAEATPFYEAYRLEEDLTRASIHTNWWIVNSSLYKANPSNKMLSAKVNEEVKWINKILDHTSGKLAVIEWTKKTFVVTNFIRYRGKNDEEFKNH